MKRIIIAGVLLLPSAAQAAGIDCAKARLPVEKAICADPQLMEYDTRIAAAYARHLQAFKGAIAPWVRTNQRRWLGLLHTIGVLPADDIEPLCEAGDKACLKDFMARRVEEIEGGAFEYAGVYKAKGGAKLLVAAIRNNDYWARLYRPGSGGIRTADDRESYRWDGPVTMLAEFGDGNGLPLAKPCLVSIRYTPLSATVTQKGACDGRNYAGVYARDLADDPGNYELSLD